MKQVQANTVDIMIEETEQPPLRLNAWDLEPTKFPEPGMIILQTYVEGYILDQATGNIMNGSIQLVVNKTGLELTQPHFVANGNYSAWTDQSPYEVSVKFSSPGYIDKTVQISVLENNGDVSLQKNSGSIPWVVILVIIGAVALYKKKSGKVGALSTSDLLPIFLIIGGVIGFSVIKKVLEMLGIWGGSDVTQQVEDANSPWKPGYWQQFSNFTYAITETTAKAYAETIHDAFTLFQDDYNVILGVFSNMRTKANVSFLSWVFQREYGEDLLQFLTNGGGILPWDGLSTKHMSELISLVGKLPKN